ncbi:hypothetical protein NDU88_004492 [Pleurodeles waltl]|uniref:Secreted protein n=1 Tax=Pleurodeles waltl TaxID=8319 RepID=A0AAV7UFM8_PLEWA|nr:hypothetical protein NDU88_004492 [Pleurodeles waltl]
MEAAPAAYARLTVCAMWAKQRPTPYLLVPGFLYHTPPGRCATTLPQSPGSVVSQVVASRYSHKVTYRVAYRPEFED